MHLLFHWFIGSSDNLSKVYILDTYTKDQQFFILLQLLLYTTLAKNNWTDTVNHRKKKNSTYVQEEHQVSKVRTREGVSLSTAFSEIFICWRYSYQNSGVWVLPVQGKLYSVTVWCSRPHCHRSAISGAEVKAKPDTSSLPLLPMGQVTALDKPIV